MNIKDELKRALDQFELPIYYVTRGKNKPPCIVYNYNLKVKTYSDNKVDSMEYIVLINVINDKDIQFTNEKIIESLFQNKFIGILPQATLQEEGGFFNTPIKCKKIIFK